MKFLLDECMPRSSREVFKLLRYDVIDAKQAGLLGKDDQDVNNFAKRSGRILVTLDKDFANVFKYKPGTYVGIVIIRPPYPATSTEINKLLYRFLKHVKKLNIRKSLVVITKNKIRIRK